MSNRTDFPQLNSGNLSLPASRMAILLDGVPCPLLEVTEIVRGSWPRFNWARIEYNPAVEQNAEMADLENIDLLLGTAKSICIQQLYNAIAPDSAASGLTVFTGWIDTVQSRLTARGEKVQITARDFSSRLEKLTVYGQRLSDEAGSSIFLPGMETVFNDNGEPNASAEPIVTDGRSYTVFSAKKSAAKFWSYADIINYLLCEYLPAGQAHTPNLKQLRVITGNQKTRDLDLTGVDLLNAVHKCCEQIGLEFRFVPSLTDNYPSEAIVFYKTDAGRSIELNIQQKDETLNISKTNIITFTRNKFVRPVTRKYIGQGDFKVYESTFELVKAWKPDLEDTNYNKFSPSTNSEFYKLKNVYRKWVLNEAGDYTGEPYNQAAAFDFSKIFGSSDFAHRRRRFYPALTADEQGKSLGYFLEVSFDNGANWWQYLYAFNILLDECGIWLSGDQLDLDSWIAALKGVLKFRITASVVSDQRLTCEVADGPVTSTAPVCEQIATLSRRFKYQKVSSQSIFANSSDTSLAPADERDDTVALYEFIRKKALADSAVIERVDLQIPQVAFDYHPADKISCAASSIDVLGCRADNRSTGYIETVHMDFKAQCTNLKIVRKRNVYL